TVWFTAKLKLDRPEDAQTLSTILGATARPDVLRHAALVSLAGAWGAGSGPGPLAAMRDAGFLDFDPPAPGQTDLTGVPAAHSQFVVVSDATPDVPNDQVAVPFATELAHDATTAVVAAEPGHDAAPKVPAQRAVYLHGIRGDSTLVGRLSTVDNLEDFRGRMATVLALLGLRSGRTGNYGVGPGADRMLPEAPK
ncbi:MAG: copper transporter, partial [Actinobacteria bacterium]|nr:copper transporter [Actinomycetota bacterium]